MGSSIGIQKNGCDVYLSYDVSQTSTRKEIDTLCKCFKQEGLQVFISDDTPYYEDEELEQKVKLIGNMMNNTRLFIICVSPTTFRSFQQSIEWNHALKDKRKIIYLMMDANYTPNNNTFLKLLVKSHQWFMLSERCLVSELLSLLD
jgi:hypothetical protein